MPGMDQSGWESDVLLCELGSEDNTDQRDLKKSLFCPVWDDTISYGQYVLRPRSTAVYMLLFCILSVARPEELVGNRHNCRVEPVLLQMDYLVALDPSSSMPIRRK